MEAQQKPLKLNYKRTFIIGFAFFGIMMLWQVYNTYCPPILTELLMEAMGTDVDKDVQYIVGVIMALDNIFALFMLPIFGALSDKTNTRFGKRMPYIVVGTILSAIVFPLIPLMFAKNSLVGTIVMILLTLVFMNAYRNPAVSLMPDITPKPLRAKANGIINLVGYIGAILAGVLALVITTGKYFVADTAGKTYKSWEIYLPFIITSFLMIFSMIVLAARINENKLIKEVKDDMARGEEMSDTVEKITSDGKLSKADKRNLILIIAAIFLWYMGFNAMETFWSNYYSYYLEINASLATSVLAICSLIAFIPAGLLAGKIGRKWTVVLGIIICVVPITCCFFLSPLITGDAGHSSWIAYIYYIFFAIAGVGWAFINCCSYPMVVELATKDNVGKFTSAYYTAAMLAQSLTPVLFGLILRYIPNDSHAYSAMFPYSALLFVAALIVFMFVKDKTGKIMPTKRGLEALDTD